MYSVVDMDTQEILAAKVIAKSSLTKRRTKEKVRLRCQPDGLHEEG